MLEIRKRVIPIKRHVPFIIACIGMSFFWPFLREYSFFGLFLPTSSDGGNGNLYYIVFLATLGIAALTALLLRKRVMALIRRRRWLIPVSATIGSLGILSVILLRDSDMENTIACCTTAVLGFCFLILLLAWSDLLLSHLFNQKTMVICIAASFVLSTVIGYAVFLPFPFNYIRPLLIPVTSGWLWYLCRYNPPQGDTGSMDVLFRHHEDRRHLWLVILMFLFIAGGSFLLGVFESGKVNMSLEPTVVFSITGILALGLVLLIFTILTSDVTKTIYLTWMATSALLVLSIIVTALASLGLRRYFQIATCSSYIFTEFFLYLVLIANTRARKYLFIPTLVFYYVTPVVLARILSYCVVPTLVARLGQTFDGIYNPLALTIASILILCMFLCVSLFVIMPQTRDATYISDVRGSTLDEVCSSIASHNNLSDRETDVLRLLAEGNTYSRVAEMLVISESTVQAHVRTLYRKLGVHTKQELIDLVNKPADK